MPLFGFTNVKELKAKKNINGLIRALNDEIKSNQIEAAEALGILGDKRAVPPLIKILRTRTEQDIRIKACESLGTLGDPRAVESLLETLNKENSVSSAAAARALGKYRDARAVEPLIRALKNGNRAASSEALVRYGEQVVERLLPLLKDNDPEVRMFIIEALGKIGDKRAISASIPLLSDKKHSVSHFAATALERMGWVPATEKEKASYWIAKNDFKKVREIGVPAVEPLLTALRFEEQKIYTSAANALGEIGGKVDDVELHKRIIEGLLLGLCDKDSWLRMSAGDALTKMGWNPEKDADGALYWLVVATSPLQKIANIIKTSGLSAFEPLLNRFTPRDGDPLEAEQKIILKALGELKDPRAVEPLIEAVNSWDIRSSLLALETLVKIGDERAIEPLKKLMLSQKDKARIIAEALRKLTGKIIQAEQARIPNTLAIFPLNGVIVYPYAAIPLKIEDQRAIRLVEDAFKEQGIIGFIATKNRYQPAPGPADFYTVGTAALVRQLVNAPDGTLRVVVEGLGCFRIVEFVGKGYYKAHIELIPEIVEEGMELETLADNIRELFRKAAEKTSSVPAELLTYICSVKEPRKLVYIIANYQPMDITMGQKILELQSATEKFKHLQAILAGKWW